MGRDSAYAVGNKKVLPLMKTDGGVTGVLGLGLVVPVMGSTILNVKVIGSPGV